MWCVCVLRILSYVSVSPPADILGQIRVKDWFNCLLSKAIASQHYGDTNSQTFEVSDILFPAFWWVIETEKNIYISLQQNSIFMLNTVSRDPDPNQLVSSFWFLGLQNTVKEIRENFWKKCASSWSTNHSLGTTGINHFILVLLIVSSFLHCISMTPMTPPCSSSDPLSNHLVSPRVYSCNINKWTKLLQWLYKVL